MSLAGDVGHLRIAGNTLYARDSDGIVSSVDSGATWRQEGMRASYDFAANDSFLFAGTFTGVYRHRHDYTPGEWELVDSGLWYIGENMSHVLDTMHVAMGVAAGDSAVYATVSVGGLLFCSTNNGTQWQKRMVTSDGFFQYLTVLHGVPYYATNLDLYRNDDGYAGRIEALTGLADLNGSLYASSRWGAYRAKSDRSTDFVDVTHGIPPYLLDVCTFGDTVFMASRDSGVYYSVDSAEHWTSVGPGLSSPLVHSILAVGNWLYAGTADGLYRIHLPLGTTAVRQQLTGGSSLLRVERTGPTTLFDLRGRIVHCAANQGFAHLPAGVYARHGVARVNSETRAFVVVPR